MATLAAFEGFVGLLYFASASGLFYGRISRPRPQLRFSSVAIVKDFNDSRALMFRLMNKDKNVLMNLKITATDNLNGFTDTIKSVFPKSATQICVVHQIRNACKYVVWKDRKEFAADMKDIYGAPNRDAAAHALDALDKKWNNKYSYAIKSWRTNWDELTVFFDFPLEIRK